jgi:plasmid stabilization system protein ParE
MTQEGNPDVPLSFAVRIDPRALDQILEAEKWLVGLAGVEIAKEWRNGLRRELAKLATHPRQFPRVPEQQYFSRETRHIVYRRSNASVAYRLVYFIDESGMDGPTVTVSHVRHAAARPLGRKTAREIENSGE